MKLLMENWRKFLKEAEEEPISKPKAIFMAGGPGSGKTTVRKKLGIDDKISNIINADDQYEADLEAAGLALNGKPAAVSRYKELKDELASLDADADAAAYEAKEAEMMKAKEPVSLYAKIFNKAQTGKKADFKKYAQARESFVVDGTGGDYNLMAKDKKDLEVLGYDVAMVYVDLDVDVCKKRNVKRGEDGRQLLDREVESSCAAVAKNQNAYESLFGQNFFYVNSEEGKIESDISAIQPYVEAFIDLEQVDEDFQSELKPRLEDDMARLLRHGGNKKSGPFNKPAPIDYRGSKPPGAPGG